MEQGALSGGQSQGSDRRWMPLVSLLPLLLVCVYLAHSSALILPAAAKREAYLSGILAALLLASPMLLGQYLLGRQLYLHRRHMRDSRGWVVMTLALTGLVVYPLLALLFTPASVLPADGAHDSAEGLAMVMVAALLWWLLEFIKGRYSGKGKRLPWLLSLDAMVLAGLLGWAMLLAGVFNSIDDPMMNQPIKLVLDLGSQLEHLGRLGSYAWQFCVMALLMFFFYWLNRYLLIRQCLSRFGLACFVVVSLLALMLLTPLLAAMVIALPINALPQDVALLVPGGNNNPFDAHNYRFMFVVWLVSTPIILAFERQQQASRLAAIAQQQAQTELQLLQQQINPHFLFNTLNSLYALTLMKTEDAPERILQLAGLLRYSVYRGQQPEVSLSEEVACLKDYLALQQIRQGARLSIDCDWPEPALAQLRLAPLLFIVLVENAFKHGLEPSQHQGWFKLEFWLQDGKLCFRCDNSLPPTEPGEGAEKHVIAAAQPLAEGGGLGLTNLSRRLALLYPDGHKLISERRDDHWHAQLEIELGQASRPAD